MTWFTEQVLGHHPNARPYRMRIRYHDGTTGQEQVWAQSMREALDKFEYWLVEHRRITTLTIDALGGDDDDGLPSTLAGKR